ncbi:MAG: hypothetical protein ACTSR2_01135 [Candidatus Hodarchaeales archaeon]
MVKFDVTIRVVDLVELVMALIALCFLIKYYHELERNNEIGMMYIEQCNKTLNITELKYIYDIGTDNRNVNYSIPPSVLGIKLE